MGWGGGGVVEGEGGGVWEMSWLGLVGVVGCWYWYPMDLDVGYCFWLFGSFWVFGYEDMVSLTALEVF